MWGFHDRRLTLRKALFNTMSNGENHGAIWRRWRWQQILFNREVRSTLSYFPLKLEYRYSKDILHQNRLMLQMPKDTQQKQFLCSPTQKLILRSVASWLECQAHSIRRLWVQLMCDYLQAQLIYSEEEWQNEWSSVLHLASAKPRSHPGRKNSCCDSVATRG